MNTKTDTPKSKLKKSLRVGFILGFIADIIFITQIAIHDKWLTTGTENIAYFIGFGGPILLLFWYTAGAIIGTITTYLILFLNKLDK